MESNVLEIKIEYVPSPKQILFHITGVPEVLYGGAKGGGKSTALVMDALAYALEFPGAQVYLFRETYDDLEANIIAEWKKRVPSELYKYNETKHIAYLVNGSEVKFRYVRNYKDAEKYQGRSIDYIGVDELTKHEERSIQELLSCCRSAKGFPPTFRATANPGGIGHKWVKRRYIAGTNYGQEDYLDPGTGNKIKFIPSTVYDNPTLMKNDPNYVKRLENLPEEKKKAFLYGDWDVYTGQAFPEWKESIHVVEDFEIPSHWRRWRTLDNGYTDPFYWGWLTISPDGIVYLYREYTRKEDQDKILYTAQAKEAERLSVLDIETKQREKLDYTVAGVDAWNSHHRDQSGKSLIDYYEEGGARGFIKAVTDRKLRKDTFHEYLKPIFDENTQKWYARFQVFKSCKHFIEHMPELVEDEKDPNKVADCNYDHAYDSVGYGLISHHVSKSRGEKVDNLGEAGKIKKELLKKLGRS